MTPQDTIREGRVAIESGWSITQQGGSTYLLLVALIVVLAFAAVYALYRLREKDVSESAAKDGALLSYKELKDHYVGLLERVEQAEKNATEREANCQRELAKTREEMEGQRLMIVSIRQKLFNKHILSNEDQRELDAHANQHSVPR